MLKLNGTDVVLTHRAADHTWPSRVIGDSGSIEFSLPRLEEVTINGLVQKTSYGSAPIFCDLPASEPSAPRGLHPGLGVEAVAVHRALAANVFGPGTPELPLDVM